MDVARIRQQIFIEDRVGGNGNLAALVSPGRYQHFAFRHLGAGCAAVKKTTFGDQNAALFVGFWPALGANISSPGGRPGDINCSRMNISRGTDTGG